MSTPTVAITGNTFPVKDQLKAMGGRWNVETKAWMVPAEKAEEARKLVAGAPSKSASTNKAYRPHKCIACGAVERRDARGYSVVRIYKSGECQDCYEERKMGY